MATSAAESLRGGSGRRALPPTTPGRSAAKATSRSGLRAIARRHPATARLNGSVGLSLGDALVLLLAGILLVDIIVLPLRARVRAPGKAKPQLSATFTEDSGNSTPKQR